VRKLKVGAQKMSVVGQKQTLQSTKKGVNPFELTPSK